MSCPFYGSAVRMVGGTIPAVLPTGGNQCGLITHAHSPCRMETEGNAPEWDACPRNPAINGTYEHGSLEANRRRELMGLPPIAGARGTPQ